MKLRVFFTLILLVLLALGIAGCGGAGSDTTAPDGPTVFIRNVMYLPDQLTVAVGETVTWIWDDGGTVHDVVGEGFKSELVAQGSFSHTFTEAGTYPYTCTIHPNMVGTVTVEG